MLHERPATAIYRPRMSSGANPAMRDCATGEMTISPTVMTSIAKIKSGKVAMNPYMAKPIA
jgi:hypothetical protein